jgi:hypothetical protein
MKEYKTIKELSKDHYTSHHLFDTLVQKGYSKNLVSAKQSYIRWEKLGIFPQVNRVPFRGKLWRVYSEKDIENILLCLKKHTIKRISVK